MTVTYKVGDTRELVAGLPDGSVDLVACSPPFLALRSYLPADHEHKHAEIGSEPDPATFLDTLLGLTAEWGRVLAPHGSIAIELGDTYAGSGGAGGDYIEGGMREGQQQFAGSGSTMRSSNAAHWRQKNARKDEWPRPKCLALIPQAYALSLAYNRNIITGQPSTAGQWLVRNMIVWHRPNPAVGALGDKFRPSTSYITVATRSAKRWFDLTAVRNGHARDYDRPNLVEYGARREGVPGQRPNASLHTSNPAGAPPLDAWFDEHDTWTITTQPSSLAHYAMWPAKLAERLILSMCPAEVCATCGEPRRRIESATYIPHGPRRDELKSVRGMGVQNGEHAQAMEHGRATKVPTTTGWTDCGHGNSRPGVVLDPFAGTGTTLAVADLHGRDATGFDIDARNADLYPARYDEVRRALFGTQPEIPGQLDMFEEVA